MDLNRHRRFTSVMPAVFVTAIALAAGLYLSFSQSGEAAITPISGDDFAAALPAAICVGSADTDVFVAAELVDTTDCPDATEAALPYTTKWLELDFSGNRIRSEFAPAAGELDGLMPGARIDLRGTGVNQNEIDLSEAIKAGSTTTARELYCALAGSYGASTIPCAEVAVTGRPPTFLLDGGDDETGLGNLPTSVDEGGIFYIPFHFGIRPQGLSFPVQSGVTCPDEYSGDPLSVTCTGSSFDGSRGRGDTVERFVAFEISISHRGLDFDRTVHVMTSSSDPDDTLYVVPVLMGNDSEIDESEIAEITVERMRVGQRQDGDLAAPMVGSDGTLATAGFELEFLYDRDAVLDGYDDDYEDDLSTATDTVVVDDNDSPRYPVCERHPQIVAAVESELNGEKCRRISLDSLGTIDELLVYPGAPDIDDALEEIYYSDLEGLTGLSFLDLGGNELRSLPSNVFRDVGVGKPDEIALIDMRFNPGRRSGSDGFLTSDLSSSVRSNLQHLQVIRLDSNFRDGKGFNRDTYTVYESDVLVFEVRNDDEAPVVEFVVADAIDADPSATPPVAARAADTAEGLDVTAPEVSDLPRLPGGDRTRLDLGDFDRGGASDDGAGTGTFVVAVRMPFTGDDDRENETFTMRLIDSTGAIDDARVTIRDVSRKRSRNISTSSQVYQAPRRPTARPRPEDSPAFDYPAFVTDNQYEVAPGNPDLRHNIPDLSVNIDGRTVIAGFLSHYRNTGGLGRWGYPTSEVLVLENRTLTQFYQRGVVDFHDVGAGWLVERRLVWDYVGGGAGGSDDQGVESGPFNPNPGTLLGPWGNRVSNVSIEGTTVGFADFFNRLGGVSAFGYPKTEARTDIVGARRLLGPEQTPGFIRQYFQAAIFEFHPNDPADPVKLALLGDTLRDRLVRDHTRERAFAGAGILVNGASYVPPVVD